MKKPILFSLFIFCMITGYAQQQGQAKPFQYLYDDVLIRQKSMEDPGLADKYVVYEENIKQIIASLKANENKSGYKTDTLINGKRIIPVVFHVIHNGGPENISREQIEDAIKLINIDYNKQNTDTGTGHTYPDFNALRADCQIEFRLAKLDPSGNCTDGIIRHFDPQTNYGYFSTMSQYCWLPSRYLNVFTVNYIYPEGMSLPDGAFIGGMSPFPPSNTLSQALTGGDTLADGVLIRHDGIGSIGTATTLGGMPVNALNRTFTHESGHYFNLYHPFQTGPLCVIFGSDGCGSTLLGCGDEVADTPPVQTASQNTTLSCYAPGSRNTCTNDSPDQPDMIENYMDYQWGYCTNLFTQGQLARINATMQSDRRKLWSKENLIFTGVMDTTPAHCAPIADFISNSRLVCVGGNLQFTDFSYSGQAQSWLWTFDGGTPSTSTDQNPLITYNTPGIYNVYLKVMNTNGSDSIMKQNLITVKPLTASAQAPFTEDFEAVILNNGWYINNDAGNAWEITDTAFFSGAKSIRIKNFTGNNAGSFDEIITPAYDLTLLPTDGTPMIKFRLAYAGKINAGTIVTSADTAFDALKMFASVDCGETWSEKYSENGIALSSANAVSGSFAPSSSAEWKLVSRPLPYSYLSNNHIMFKFVFHSNAGNNLYIDDINITGSTVGFDEIALSKLNFTIQPNPVSDVSEIQFNLEIPALTRIVMYDVLSNEVKEIANTRLGAGLHTFSINKDDFGGKGVYFVRAEFEGNIMVRKIVVE